MAHVSDCAETLLKNGGRECGFLLLASWHCRRHTTHSLSVIAHCTAGTARSWPFIFPVNGIDPQKSCAYRNSIHLWLFRWTQLINEISNGALRSVSIQRQWFTEALREVFCHFVSALIKEWQPYIHDYIPCYLLWLQGQTNKPCTSAITFFIKPPCSYFPNTRLGFLFCIRADCWRIFSACESMSVITTYCEGEPVNIPGLFSRRKKKRRKKKSFFHVITSPSVLLIPLPHNVQRMSRKLATDAGLLQRENTFFLSAAMCLASPESEVIIYLICSPNKLLTLIFVSQHVSSWFVIESQ